MLVLPGPERFDGRMRPFLAIALAVAAAALVSACGGGGEELSRGDAAFADRMRGEIAETGLLLAAVNDCVDDVACMRRQGGPLADRAGYAAQALVVDVPGLDDPCLRDLGEPLIGYLQAAGDVESPPRRAISTRWPSARTAPPSRGAPSRTGSSRACRAPRTTPGCQPPASSARSSTTSSHPSTGSTVAGRPSASSARARPSGPRPRPRGPGSRRSTPAACLLPRGARRRRPGAPRLRSRRHRVERAGSRPRPRRVPVLRARRVRSPPQHRALRALMARGSRASPGGTLPTW